MILLIISLFLIFILTKFIKKFKTEELFTINISDKLIKVFRCRNTINFNNISKFKYNIKK